MLNWVKNTNLLFYSCFGVVLRPPDSVSYTCLVFAEFDSTQPVTSVVNYVQRVMRSRWHYLFDNFMVYVSGVIFYFLSWIKIIFNDYNATLVLLFCVFSIISACKLVWYDKGLYYNQKNTNYRVWSWWKFLFQLTTGLQQYLTW